jgi:hypothetical protein
MGGNNKPINLAKERCTPTSSNCVIWQGPDLKCIDLCKGDSISEIVYKLACKLCDLVDQTDVSTYDLDCLDLDKCNFPESFRELIQVLIDSICEIKTQLGTTTPSNSGSGCPTCELVTATCFQAELGPYANIDTYVIALGNKICDQELLIETQQQAIEQLFKFIEAVG